MTNWDERVPATPYPDAPVLAWPLGAAAPTLPPGTAGISVRVRARRTDPDRDVAPKAIGVDGRPMWNGVGRMVVVTEPGEHLVELWGQNSPETTRRVRVGAGEIVELEYRMPRVILSTEGVLVPAPARRRPGAGMNVALAASAVVAVCLALGNAMGIPFGPVPAIAVLVALPTLMWLINRLKRGADRRYRAEMSAEAREDPRSAATGMFLADGSCPSGVTDARHGALVMTVGAWRDYVRNGLGVAQIPVADPNAWLPWPELTIDGAPWPLSWRTWCYRLPAGVHDIVVSPQGPAGGATGAPIAGAVEPLRVTVEVAAGELTRLNVRVKAKIQVENLQVAHRGGGLRRVMASSLRDPRAPTRVVRFDATVDELSTGDRVRAASLHRSR